MIQTVNKGLVIVINPKIAIDKLYSIRLEIPMRAYDIENEYSDKIVALGGSENGIRLRINKIPGSYSVVRYCKNTRYVIAKPMYKFYHPDCLLDDKIRYPELIRVYAQNSQYYVGMFVSDSSMIHVVFPRTSCRSLTYKERKLINNYSSLSMVAYTREDDYCIR